MKVIHVAESFAAGVMHFIAQLTQSLPEYEHVVIHGARPDTPADFLRWFPQPVRFVPWQGVGREINPWRDAVALWRLMRLLKQQDADIIHLHSSKAGFLGRIAALLLGQTQRVIYTPHGVAFLRQDVANVKQAIFVGLEKFAHACGGKVIACSASEAACLRSHNIAADFINNGVNCTPQVDSLADRAATKDAKMVTVTLVGRISAQKNPRWYNDIASAFVMQPHVRFVWVGGGEQRHLLTAPNITVTGWVKPDEVAAYLQAADIYLSTSAWEGLPLSALQAMCHRLPLVLSHCTGHVDIVQAGMNGFLFQNTAQAINVLQTLINEPAHRQRMGQASRDSVEQQFDVQQMAEGYRQQYEHVWAALSRQYVVNST